MTDSHPELNGSRPESSEAELIADALAVRLGPMLGQAAQMLPQVMNVLPQMIAQAMTQRPRWCLHCLRNRIGWETAHKAEMDTALGMAAKAAGLAEGDPRAGQLDMAPFLPDRLRPGSGHTEAMPPVNDWVTIAGGDTVCAGHVAGPGAQGPSLIVPPRGMPVSMAAALAGRLG